jgi:hypothetical protein
MVKTNIQTFTGEVEILSNLHVGSYLTANGDASNVLDVTGNVGASFFVGDGGLISNIATTLSDIVDQGNLVSNVVQFNAPPAAYAGVGIVTASNVGIQNSNPLNTLSIADKIIIDKDVSEPSTTMNVHGKVYASRFEGDGGLLSNIATTLEAIINQGNVSANVVKFSSATDYAGVGLVTDSNVGIQNTAPVFNLSVGSNVHIDDEGSNVLTVHGNVSASNLNLGVFTVSASHGLDQVCAESNVVARPVRFSNVITAISAVSNIESAGTFISTDAERGIDVASNIDIGGRLKFDSNVFIDTLRVADVAANLVTYDRVTGELTDSGGTFLNKFAIVSEQPPSDFFANTTTVTNHGSYTLTTSNLATNSNTYNAFDGTANAWVSGDLAGGYIGGANVFLETNLTQLSNLHPTQFGDWLAIEFPYKTTLRHMKLTPLTAAQFPASANIYATNNDLTWTEVNYWKDVNPVTASNVQTITVNATEQFKKYALVATKAAGDSSNVALQDWQLFTESFSIDGGKVAMAQQAATGGETVMDQHGPHGRGVVPLKKYPEIAFEEGKFDRNDSTNTYVQAGYTVTASGKSSSAPWAYVWGIFDETEGDEASRSSWIDSNNTTYAKESADAYGGLVGNVLSTVHNTNTLKLASNTPVGAWFTIELPNSIKLDHIQMRPGRWGTDLSSINSFPREFGIWGYEGNAWTLIKTVTEHTATNNTSYLTTIINSNTPYEKIGFVITRINAQGSSNSNDRQFTTIGALKLYGYEEDPPAGDTSVDTTFTSIMNTPQTTGAQVYVDGSLGETFTNRVVGPTVSNTHTTYVSTEKYWELSGNVESNVTLEANTFLSGDAPHSLSMWFKSSNLVSNASNSCIFSLGTEERLDHVSAAFSNTYQTVQKLLASDGAAGDRFGAGDEGMSLGMSGDGSVVVVGAKYDDSQTGAAYIFIKNSNGHWNEVQKLTASDAATGDRFGAGVDISSDGNYIAIGSKYAHSTDGNNTSNVGKLYIFKRTVSTNIWSEQQILSSSHESVNDFFGERVSISSDGTYVVAASKTDDETESDGGAAYVFKRTDNTWNTTPFRLISGSVAASDFFGQSVEISNDGNFIVVGAGGDNGVGSDDDGVVFMFARTGDNTWVQQQEINNPSVSGINNYFGGENQCVSISSDGTYLIVGAWGSQHTGTGGSDGAIFFFQRTGSSTSDWTWSLMGSMQTNPSGATNELFGRAVKMSPDGTVALAHSYDDGTVSGAGAVFVYKRSGSTWTYSRKIQHIDQTAQDLFGSSLAISTDGSYFVAGMEHDDDLGTRAGAAYIYTRDTTHHLTTDLKLQSNTWHNLTYAYQGEGGSKVTYLDGRKVAEDQAEDTFGEYPPFAMTGYSQGGYVVSASDTFQGFSPYLAFNKVVNTTGDYWFAGDDVIGTTDGYTGSVGGDHSYIGTDSLGGYTGIWLKLEMPHKLALSYVEFYAVNDSMIYTPRDFFVIGSNDDITWDLIHRETSTAADSTFTSGRPITTNSANNHNKYKYIAIVIDRTVNDNRLGIGEMKLYGHRENDLVRLPDPTNVLKYPHIAMTGYAQRGYVVSASNETLADGNRVWHVFDENDSTFWKCDERYTSAGVENTSSGLTDTSSTAHGGEYVVLESPNKLNITGFNLTRDGTNSDTIGRSPGSIAFLGKNSAPTVTTGWTLIAQQTTSTYTNNVAPLTISGNSNYFKYHAVVIRSIDGNQLRFHIKNIELLGTEEASSVPIQIGGGNIDKVANFRVYDKFVGEDQALEIWDAQKDEFGRAKSSMTLQKGRLGIGTTEPQGRLAVADEPHNLEEFPPRAMTGYKTYFEGHGEFCASASDEHSSDYDVQNAFNKITNRLNSSGGTTNTYYNGGEPTPRYYDSGNDYAYSGTSSTHGLGGVMGEWVKLEFPYKANISQISILPVDIQISTLAPEDFTIMGSSDDINWTTLRTVTGATWTAHNFNEYTLPSTISYKYFALVVSRTVGANQLSIQELRYFGTREQGQSVLHDGQLTLTKSLTVPRIGPALDADNTPHRDRLVVEYNTSTNPTFDGAVRDTSGRGNDAIFRDTASYNAVDKAFNFTSHNKDLFVARDNISGVSGDILATISLWFKTDDTTQTTGMTMFEIGNSNTNFKKLRIFLYQDDVYMGIGSTSYVYAPSNDVIRGKWTHVVGIKKSTGAIGTGSINSSHNSVFEIYIDGVKKAVTSWTGTGILNLDRENQMITVGAGSTNSITRYNGFDGHISNVKFWGGVALTDSEVKTLYDMGRCDEGHHVVNFSKTRVRGLISNDTVEMAEIVITNPAQPSTRGIYSNDNATRLHWAKGVHDFEWGSPGNGFFYIRYNGAERGYFHYNTGNFGQIDFTGQHRSFIDAIPQNMHSQYVGMIVCANKNKYYDLSSNTIITGNKAINVSEALPLVSLSNVALDKTCYGVISNTEYGEIKNREYEMGTFVSVSEKPEGDNRAIVNSVGEGAIWVTNTNGSLESGDYITTSNVTGYGQKQDDDVLHNYTVAKITMDCDFNPATQPIQQILRSNVIQTYYLGNVHKVKNVPHEFVTTTVTADDAWSNVSVSPSDVTYAEWSNLEANTQNTYTLTYTQTSNVVYDTKYTLTTTANVTESDAWDRVSIDPPGVTYAEYSNLEANTQSSYSLTFTKTTTDEKTPEEWSSLESNTQSLYNMVYYQSVEEEVASDYPGATTHTRVTDVIENELDAHGQIQWEDHATETEKAYKIRYLDASGAQTDEANAVHIAAFVGCTYHCG